MARGAWSWSSGNPGLTCSLDDPLEVLAERRIIGVPRFVLRQLDFRHHSIDGDREVVLGRLD
jgi:hypothetical protein